MLGLQHLHQSGIVAVHAFVALDAAREDLTTEVDGNDVLRAKINVVEDPGPGGVRRVPQLLAFVLPHNPGSGCPILAASRGCLVGGMRGQAWRQGWDARKHARQFWDVRARPDLCRAGLS
jgi:hypothetical protein